MINVAQKVKGIEDFINEIKARTSTPEPIKLALTPIASQFRVGHYTIGVLKDMGLLKYEKIGNDKVVQWAYGAGKIDSKLAEKVYEAAKEAERNIPSRQAKLKADKAIKVIDKAPPIPPMPEKNVVKLNTPMLNQHKQQAKTARKAEEAAVNLAAKDIGTVFGYKQLQYLGGEYFDKPTDVVVDGNSTYFKVGAIKYKVEDSNLAISIYSFQTKETIDELPDECLIAEIRVKNTVVGLKKHGGDSQMAIVQLKLVPVKDPYKLV